MTMQGPKIQVSKIPVYVQAAGRCKTLFYLFCKFCICMIHLVVLIKVQVQVVVRFTVNLRLKNSIFYSMTSQKVLIKAAYEARTDTSH